MIVIQGMVGAGKSTLSKILAHREKITLFPEPVETNPYLDKFYESPAEYSFAMQVFLLHARFMDTLKAQELDSCIMDANVYTNDLFSLLHFSSGYMTRDDYHLNYLRISDTYKSLVKPPTLMVYLQCSTEVAVQRIMKRKRASELRAPIKYWADFNELYEQWFQEYTDSPKMVINVDNLDIVGNPEDVDAITELIMSTYRVHKKCQE